MTCFDYQNMEMLSAMIHLKKAFKHNAISSPVNKEMHGSSAVTCIPGLYRTSGWEVPEGKWTVSKKVWRADLAHIRQVGFYSGLQEVILPFEKRRTRYKISSLKAEKAALGRGSSMSTSYLELGMKGGIHLPTGIPVAGMFTLLSLQYWRKYFLWHTWLHLKGHIQIALAGLPPKSTCSLHFSPLL